MTISYCATANSVAGPIMAIVMQLQPAPAA